LENEPPPQITGNAHAAQDKKIQGQIYDGKGGDGIKKFRIQKTDDAGDHAYNDGQNAGGQFLLEHRDPGAAVVLLPVEESRTHGQHGTQCAGQEGVKGNDLHVRDPGDPKNHEKKNRDRNQAVGEVDGDGVGMDFENGHVLLLSRNACVESALLMQFFNFFKGLFIMAFHQLEVLHLKLRQSEEDFFFFFG